MGAQLVERAIATAMEQGAARMFLEVAVDNDAGQALYRALGFAEIARRPAYYGKPGQKHKDALLMSRDLI